MVYFREADYEDVLKQISEGESSWSVISAINFEECSVTLFNDLLKRLRARDSNRVRLLPIRLVSRRASPWSSLELVKEQFQESLQQIAKSRSINFPVRLIEYPSGQDAAVGLLASAQEGHSNLPNLVIDVSSLPREFVVFLCDLVCGLAQQQLILSFANIFFVQTPPDRITSRQGLGPFSVGSPRCVYNSNLVRRQPDSLKTSLLIFPGYEGFEAIAAADSVAGHDSSITAAISYFDDLLFPTALNVMVANQSLFSDSTDGSITIQYYFSEFDSMRVALDSVKRAVDLCEEFPQYRHAFLVAPFGPKCSLIMATVARQQFHQQCRERVPNAFTISDVLILPTSQYVSFYSRGARPPRVFHWRIETTT